MQLTVSGVLNQFGLMNYSRMLQHHKDSKAEVTLATLPICPTK